MMCVINFTFSLPKYDESNLKPDPNPFLLLISDVSPTTGEA